MTAITQTREHLTARTDRLKRKAFRILLVLHTGTYLRSTTPYELSARWFTLGGMVIGAAVNYFMSR